MSKEHPLSHDFYYHMEDGRPVLDPVEVDEEPSDAE